MLTAVSLAMSALVSSAVSAIAGLGGGVLLFAVLNLFVTPQVALALHAFAQFASNLSRTVAFHRFICWKLFPPFAAGSAVGVILAGYVFLSVPERALEFTIGLLLGMYAVFDRMVARSPFVRSIKTGRSFLIIGGATGFLSMIVGAAGPLVAPFLREFTRRVESSTSLSHRMFIATKATLQVWVQGTKSAAFLFAFSFPVADHSDQMITLLVFVVIGTYLGRWVLGRLDTKYLDLMVRSAILLIAIKMCLGL